MASTGDDIELVLNVAIAIGDEVHRARMPVDNGHHIRAVIRLQRRFLHKISQNRLRFGIFFEVDGNPQTALIGLIADFIDAGDGLVVANLVDLTDKVAFHDAIRNFANDDLLITIGIIDNRGLRSDVNTAMEAIFSSRVSLIGSAIDRAL